VQGNCLAHDKNLDSEDDDVTQNRHGKNINYPWQHA
jgi:hypothetical protein